MHSLNVLGPNLNIISMPFFPPLNSGPGRLHLAAGSTDSEHPAVPVPGAFLPKDPDGANPQRHPWQQVKCLYGDLLSSLSAVPASFCSLLFIANSIPFSPQRVALCFAPVTCLPALLATCCCLGNSNATPGE